MAAYNIPRDTKGEGRILFIFSTKALIYTAIGAVPGLLFYAIFSALGMEIVGIVMVAIFAFIGFSIATFKIPKIKGIEATKDIGGEQIDEIIKRVIKFRNKKIKKYTIYSINREDKPNGK